MFVCTAADDWKNREYQLSLIHIFGVYWMIQYLKSAISPALVESARIDGCRDFMIFIKIVLPNIKPAIITLLMMSFLLSWNNYLVPLILLNKTSVFTLPLGIKSLGSAFRVDHAARIMGLALGTIPIIIPVSYTHLDVYKRQPVHRGVFPYGFKGPSTGAL